MLKETEQKGEIMIVGAMYDIATGKVTWYDAPAAAIPARATTTLRRPRRHAPDIDCTIAMPPQRPVCHKEREW